MHQLYMLAEIHAGTVRYISDLQEALGIACYAVAHARFQTLAMRRLAARGPDRTIRITDEGRRAFRRDKWRLAP
ncbi:MAG: hypothetical protein HUU29_00210 [Planctomycetaceae bacterium]|nr:hypothetical protein [Planctomycetaceae bacterium]